jgi:hypothetical protein
MGVGLFRKIRRKRVIRLDEDLAFGVKKVMRERWDFLTLIEFSQNLEELETLLRNEKIVKDELSKNQTIESLEKLKRDYPFDHRVLPEWDVNQFIQDVLWVAGTIKQVILVPSTDMELPSFHPLARTWKILDGFFAAEQRRRDIMEEEEKRITTFILVAVKKHIYYMQFFIDIMLIVIGIIIGWLFAR